MPPCAKIFAFWSSNMCPFPFPQMDFDLWGDNCSRHPISYKGKTNVMRYKKTHGNFGNLGNGEKTQILNLNELCHSECVPNQLDYQQLFTSESWNSITLMIIVLPSSMYLIQLSNVKKTILLFASSESFKWLIIILINEEYIVFMHLQAISQENPTKHPTKRWPKAHPKPTTEVRTPDTTAPVIIFVEAVGAPFSA